MAVRNFTHGSLTIEDGSVPPKQLIIPLDQGDMTFEDNKEAAVAMSRGKLAEFVEGVEVPVAITFSLLFQEWASKNVAGAVYSVRDFLKGIDSNRNPIAGLKSVSACGPYVVKLTFHIDNPCDATAGDKDETLNFVPFHADNVAFAEEEESNKLNVTGKALLQSPESLRV